MNKRVIEVQESIEFSVVVPYYNTPLKAFETCIQSIVSQTLRNFEIIVVDDGSTEENSEKARALCLTNQKVRYFKTCNKGVSAARNYGMSKTKGRYITFVDSDDEVEPLFLETAKRILDTSRVKLLIGGVAADDEQYRPVDPETVEVLFFDKERIGSVKKHMIDERLMLDTGGHISRGPVARIVDREYALEHLFAESVKIGEDLLWNLSMLKDIDKVCIAKCVWYRYHYNPHSATHKYNPNIIKEEEHELRELKKWVQFENNEEYCAFHNHIFECLRRVFECYIFSKWNDNISKRELVRQLYVEDPWRMITAKRYWHLTSFRFRVKIMLYRLKLLFAFWEIKERVMGFH